MYRRIAIDARRSCSRFVGDHSTKVKVARPAEIISSLVYAVYSPFTELSTRRRTKPMARPTRVIAKHVVAMDAISAPWLAICATSTIEAFTLTAPPRTALAETLRELHTETKQKITHTVSTQPRDTHSTPRTRRRRRRRRKQINARSRAFAPDHRSGDDSLGRRKARGATHTKHTTVSHTHTHAQTPTRTHDAFHAPHTRIPHPPTRAPLATVARASNHSIHSR